MLYQNQFSHLKSFGKNKINFWDMIYGEEGVYPNPAKVQALDYITPPKTKEELLSFLRMMHSSSDFIPNFAKESGNSREVNEKEYKS